jgi:uncharacterized Zn finger protein (UPF0148 family)
MVLTAKDWGWSPTAIIRGAKNPRKAHPADYNFALAVHTLLEEKCPQCGVPIWWAFSTDSAIGFKLKTITCHACAHKDKNSPEHKDKKAGESQVVYAAPEDGFDELPSRANYFERAQKEHALEHQREMKRKAKAEAE